MTRIQIANPIFTGVPDFAFLSSIIAALDQLDNFVRILRHNERYPVRTDPDQPVFIFKMQRKLCPCKPMATPQSDMPIVALSFGEINPALVVTVAPVRIF